MRWSLVVTWNVSDEIGHLADALTVVTAVLVLAVPVLSWPGVARWLVTRRATKIRHENLRDGLIGGAGGRLPPITLAAHRARVALRFEGVELTAAWELDWLSAQVGHATMGNCVSFDLRRNRDRILELARSYRAIAAALRTRSLLVGQQPLMDEEAALAQQVYAILLDRANLLPLPRPESVLAATQKDSAFTLSFPTLTLTGASAARELTMVPAWTRKRLVVDGTRSKQVAELDEHSLKRRTIPVGELSATHHERLDRLIASPHTYDGVLPYLQDWTLCKDKGDGSTSLFLAIQEVSYFAHVVLADPASVALRDRYGSRCLTLSLLVITSDNRIVAVRRSPRDAWYPDQWGPGVNGNLDIPVPGRKDADRDPVGLPDFRRSLVREGREELGLDLVDEHIQFQGLAHFDSGHREVGTYQLVATARSHRTAEEIAAGARYADPILGAWEIGGELLSLRMPTTKAEADKLLSWVWQSAEVTPLFAGAVTLFLGNSDFIEVDSWGRWGDGPTPSLEDIADVIAL